MAFTVRPFRHFPVQCWVVANWLADIPQKTHEPHTGWCEARENTRSVIPSRLGKAPALPLPLPGCQTEQPGR